MKAMLTSLVLAVALLFSPGLAKADTHVSSGPMEGSSSTLASATEIDVTGLSLSPGYGKFTGKLKVKAFVMVKGMLKVKVSLKGWIVDANGFAIFVTVDDFLMAVVDLDASCDLLKVSLGMLKVKVLGLDIEIRLDESVLVLTGEQCKDKKKLCQLAVVIHGKKHCALIVKLLNALWGFPHDCDKDCDDDCDKDCDDDCDKDCDDDCDKDCDKDHGKGHCKCRGKGHDKGHGKK